MKANLICDTALAHYLTHYKPMLIGDLARACGTNARTVHAALWDRHSDFSLCDVDVCTGTTWTARSRVAPAVEPSREYLARLLNQARSA